MKYKKCPRCGLNYVLAEEEICIVCKNELDGKKSIFDEFDEETVLCPYCEQNFMGLEDVMCKQCRKKRNKAAKDDC